jgi:anti-sigma factor RsiW
MTTTCSSPLSWETLVAYWAGDLDAAQTDRVDEHVMGCDVCSEESARVAQITEGVRSMIPVFLSPERLAALRARRTRIIENPVAAGTSKTALFPLGADVLLHRLGGLDLEGVETAHVTVLHEETGEVLLVDEHAPFDRDAGEILVACQRHFGTHMRTIVFEVRTRVGSGTTHVARYAIPHEFEAQT